MLSETFAQFFPFVSSFGIASPAFRGKAGPPVPTQGSLQVKCTCTGEPVANFHTPTQHNSRASTNQRGVNLMDDNWQWGPCTPLGGAKAAISQGTLIDLKHPCLQSQLCPAAAEYVIDSQWQKAEKGTYRVSAMLSLVLAFLQVHVT